MKIELKDKKVFFENQGIKKEIHPFWLRERVNGDGFVDKGTQQRLFDPSEPKRNIKIDSSIRAFKIEFPGANNIQIRTAIQVSSLDSQGRET